MQQTYNDFSVFQTNNSIDSDCADITFRNAGSASNVILNNGISLAPNQFITFTANKDEIDKTKYFFRFELTGGGPPTFKLVVIRRKYIGDIAAKKKFYNDFVLKETNDYVDSNCADITFYNSSFTNITINKNILLFPLTFVAFRVNEMEMDKTIYSFDLGNPIFGGRVTVIRKKYIL